MEESKRIKAQQKTIYRWSLVLTGVIFLFWTGYHFIAGAVPVSESVQIFRWEFSLPFAISRWWDLMLGPILATVYYLPRIFWKKEVLHNVFSREEIKAPLNITAGLFGGSVLVSLITHYCSYIGFSFLGTWYLSTITALGCIIIAWAVFCVLFAKERKVESALYLLGSALIIPFLAGGLISVFLGVAYLVVIPLAFFFFYLLAFIVAATFGFLIKIVLRSFSKDLWKRFADWVKPGEEKETNS